MTSVNLSSESLDSFHGITIVTGINVLTQSMIREKLSCYRNKEKSNSEITNGLTG